MRYSQEQLLEILREAGEEGVTAPELLRAAYPNDKVKQESSRGGVIGKLHSLAKRNLVEADYTEHAILWRIK